MSRRTVLDLAMERFGAELPENPEPLPVFSATWLRPERVRYNDGVLSDEQKFDIKVHTSYVVGVQMPTGKRNSNVYPIVRIVNQETLDRCKGHRDLALHYADGLDALRFLAGFHVTREEAKDEARDCLVKAWTMQLQTSQEHLENAKKRAEEYTKDVVRAKGFLAKARKA